MRFRSSIWITIGLAGALAGCATARRPGMPGNPTAKAYSPTSMCRGCHDQIVAQHLQSSHEMSFTNPAFQAQYQKDLLPKALQDLDLHSEACECIACHEPITYATKGPQVILFESIDSEMNGVTCDVCHTITGYRSSPPQNGNYIIAPSEVKFGPFNVQSNWHHAYSELHSKSEICAVCHEAVNHHGFQIKATFTEWKESVFAQQAVHCQDCHMNVDGFLTGGKSRFSSGKAARMNLGSAPDRDQLYTHQFPGAHSKTQIEGAIELAIEAKPKDNRTMVIEVTVDNSRTGHSMPSGSADLRLLWLELTVRVGDRLIAVPAGGVEPEVTANSRSNSISGHGDFDAELLGPEIPRGCRVYRAIFADANGQATLNSYDAVAKLFDNRLKAAEKRKEFYQLTIPAGMEGNLSIEATLKYIPYSTTFTDRFGLPKPETVIVARRKIALEPLDKQKGTDQD